MLSSLFKSVSGDGMREGGAETWRERKRGRGRERERIHQLSINICADVEHRKTVIKAFSLVRFDFQHPKLQKHLYVELHTLHQPDLK